MLTRRSAPFAVVGELLDELVQEGVLPKERASRILERFDQVLEAWSRCSMKAAGGVRPVRDALRSSVGT